MQEVPVDPSDKGASEVALPSNLPRKGGCAGLRSILGANNFCGDHHKPLFTCALRLLLRDVLL